MESLCSHLGYLQLLRGELLGYGREELAALARRAQLLPGAFAPDPYPQGVEGVARLAQLRPCRGDLAVASATPERELQSGTHERPGMGLLGQRAAVDLFDVLIGRELGPGVGERDAKPRRR